MNLFFKPFRADPVIWGLTILFVVVSIFILNSLSPGIFPKYYFYILISFIVFYLFFFIGFGIIKYFSFHLYLLSIVLLVLTLVIGQVTRGTVRWIPIGGFSFQASEIVKPFLLLYFADFFSRTGENNRNKVLYILLAVIPVLLVAVQPSLSVSFLILLGIGTIFIIKTVNRKSILLFGVIILLSLPATWFLLQPYQRDRIVSFINYEKDPKGSGYNTIQSVISIGSGEWSGRGFKKGYQTQLKYLPEKHTDFVFAGISEELGFLGSFFILVMLFIFYYRILGFTHKPDNDSYNLFLIGSVVMFVTGSLINIGMNLGMLPVSGLPLPFISAGGSSLISSMITVALILSGKNIKPLS